jgi:uroporphyrinogen decarboxylase
MTNSRQLIDGLLRGRQVERLGHYDGPWPDTLAAWVTQGYPMRRVHKEAGETRWDEDGRRTPVETAGEYLEPVPFAEHFNIDVVSAGGWFEWVPLRGYDELLQETDEWVIRRNGAGATTRTMKHKVGMVEHLDFRMNSRAVWERDYRPHLLELDPARYDAEAVAHTRRRLAALRRAGVWSYYLHQFVWQNLSQSLGEAVLFESLLLDPDWIRDFNRVYTDFYITHYTYLFETAGLPDGIFFCDDLGYKNGLFASPKVLGDLIFPFYREMVDLFHSYDLPVIFHTCGGIAKAMPLIIEAGFDAINPIERKALGNDPFAFAEQYGDRIALTGGIDVRVYETNDKEIIRREVAEFVQGMKARGARLIAAADAGIPSTVRYDTYCYAVEVLREHWAY